MGEEREKADSRGRDQSEIDRQMVPSSELLGKQRRLQILHNDEIYVLRITSNGKLILTK